jgi:hypothetical protein
LNQHSTFTTHPGEDVLELYCLDRLDEGELAPIEEHLMVCEACQKRVTDLDVFLKAARRAARELQEEKYASPKANWSWLFRPGWAVAGALAVMTIAFLPSLRRTAEPQDIAISALRGAAEDSGAGIAQAGRPLRLNLDLTGIDAAGCCAFELVSGEGKVLRKFAAAPTGGQALLIHDEGLRGGQYWIRVKSNSGEDLREFGLVVR